jgi:hypothetical protein
MVSSGAAGEGVPALLAQLQRTVTAQAIAVASATIERDETLHELALLRAERLDFVAREQNARELLEKAAAGGPGAALPAGVGEKERRRLAMELARSEAQRAAAEAEILRLVRVLEELSVATTREIDALAMERAHEATLHHARSHRLDQALAELAALSEERAALEAERDAALAERDAAEAARGAVAARLAAADEALAAEQGRSALLLAGLKDAGEERARLEAEVAKHRDHAANLAKVSPADTQRELAVRMEERLAAERGKWAEERVKLEEALAQARRDRAAAPQVLAHEHTELQRTRVALAKERVEREAAEKEAKHARASLAAAEALADDLREQLEAAGRGAAPPEPPTALVHENEYLAERVAELERLVSRAEAQQAGRAAAGGSSEASSHLLARLRELRVPLADRWVSATSGWLQEGAVEPLADLALALQDEAARSRDHLLGEMEARVEAELARLNSEFVARETRTREAHDTHVREIMERNSLVAREHKARYQAQVDGFVAQLKEFEQKTRERVASIHAKYQEKIRGLEISMGARASRLLDTSNASIGSRAAEPVGVTATTTTTTVRSSSTLSASAFSTSSPAGSPERPSTTHNQQPHLAVPLPTPMAAPRSPHDWSDSAIDSFLLHVRQGRERRMEIVAAGDKSTVPLTSPSRWISHN